MGLFSTATRRLTTATIAGTVCTVGILAGAGSAQAAGDTPIAGPADFIARSSRVSTVYLTTGAAATSLLWLDTNRDGWSDTATYCIENRVPIDMAINSRGGYSLYDWDGYRSAATGWSTSRGKVAWVLAHSVPTQSTATVLLQAGVPFGGTTDDVTSATQAAIWYFTDGVALDVRNPWNTRAQRAVFTYLVNNASAMQAPASSLAFDTASVTGQTGTLLGPVTVKSPSPATVNATLPQGFSLVASDGRTVVRSGSAVAGGARLYLRVPADAAPGTLDVTATARAEGAPAGMVWDSPSVKTQALVNAATTRVDLQAATTFRWSVAAPAQPAPATPIATTKPTTATPEPTATTTPEPVITATPAPVATTTAESATSTTPETVATTTATPDPIATTPVTEPVAEPTVTSAPQPTSTATAEPGATAAPEPVVTDTTQPTTTATPEPVATTTPEPTATTTTKPTTGTTPEVAPTSTTTPMPVVTTSPTPGPVQTPVATPAPTAVVAPPAKPKPAPVVTVTPKPVASKPRLVTRTFQVDRYAPLTTAAARMVAALDDDGALRFREDRALWGRSRWQFVTVSVPVNATPAQLVAAINARTSASVGDVRTAQRLRTLSPRSTVTIAWELGRGATAKQPWGPTGRSAQTFVARS